MKDFFLIGKIISLFGKNGFIKIEPVTYSPERFFELKIVFIDFWGDKKKLYVEDVKQIGNYFSLKFKNFNDERESGLFIGREIFIEKADLIKLPENSFFIHDLIGSIVFKGGVELGEITDVLTPPANDVIVIKGMKNKEILIPLVLEFIEKFDPEKKILILKKEVSYDDED